MFVQELHDFDFRVGHDARLARINVELEQSTHTIGSIFTDRYVKHSLAVVVDRVLIDAVQRTQQLARARVAMKRCEMQRRPTFVVKKKYDFGLNINRHFLKKKQFLRNNWPIVVSLICSRAPSNQHQRRIAGPAVSCYMYCLPTYDTSRDWSELIISKIIVNIYAYPFIVSKWILAPFLEIK